MRDSLISLNLRSPAVPKGQPAAERTDIANGLQRAEVALKKNETVIGLDDLVAKGTISSYSQKADKIVVQARTPEGLAEAQSLPHNSRSLGGGLLEAVRSVFIPPNLKENCAPEYLRYRLWSLGSAVCDGAISYMSTAVFLDATRIAFSTSQKAATACVVFGILQRFASMGSSFLAKKGDADPKKSNLISSLLASGSAVAAVVILAALPHAYIPLVALTTIVGAVASALGNSAGVNIFNHMAKGNAKGLVGSKNGNQDLLAGLAGAPLAAGIAALSHVLKMNPYVAVAAVAGPILGLCTLQAARTIQMSPLSLKALDQIADGVIETGDPPEAAHRGTFSLLRSLVFPEPSAADGRIHAISDLDDVAPPGQAEELYELCPEDYLVNVVDGDARLGIPDKASLSGVVRGWMHARLMERALQSPLWPALQQRCGDRAGLALVDLTGRSLPDTTELVDNLGDKGWNQNAAAINIPRLQARWHKSGEPPSRLMLSMSEFNSLMEQPDPALLDKFLNPALTGEEVAPRVSA